MSPGASLLALLRSARQTRQLIEAIPADQSPTSVAMAYDIAQQLAQGRQTVAGWKVGATSLRGQQMLGLGEAFFGRIFADTLLRAEGGAPRMLNQSAAAAPYALEPEIAFLMGADFPARARPYTLLEVAGGVAAIMPALEVNRPSYVRPFEAGGLALIADNGVNFGAACGAAIHEWRSIDLTNIGVNVTKNGNPVAEGHSQAVFGNPMVSLAWLANALPRFGCVLTKGQVVLSGAMTPPIDAALGDEIFASFDGIGAAGLRFITPD